MVYINSRGEVVDNDRPSPTNIFWKIINFFVMFFKTLIGIEDRPDKKNDGPSGAVPSKFHGGGSGGRPGGGSGPGSNGPKKFGPRGFKSVTDLPGPPPTTCCGAGGCS